MKAYLITSGSIFALFGASHFFITYEHWRRAGSNLEAVLPPVVIAVLGTTLAVWAFRLTKGVSRSATR